MTKNKHINQFVLMVVFNAIQYDARVIRTAEVIDKTGIKVIVISNNSDPSYKNNHFTSISHKTNKKGWRALLSFWFFVFFFTIRNKNAIRLLYLHDYFMCSLGVLLSTITGSKWVYDAHELLIERKDTELSFRRLFFLSLEKINIKQADLVIAANNERERIMRFVYRLKNTANVLNISTNIIHNQSENITTKENYIVYQGYLSKDREIEDYILLLINLPNNIKLKIIGGGPDLDYFKHLVVKLNLEDRVFFTGKIPYSQLIEENMNCKVGIVSYSLNGLNNYYCSPNKLYEYAQLKIPMIFSSQPFLINIANKYRIGEVISRKMSEKEKANLIIKLFDNLNFYQENISSFLSDYTHDHEMHKLKESIRNLMF